jgi:multidrug efflux pump subunit AcrA (membrane-fusion protein)
VHGPIIAGLLVTVVFLGGFGAWAAVAPLSSAAVAAGEVRVETHRKTVQHMEGGIIREILVREGEVVKPGQLLVRLDDTQSVAKLAALRSQQSALQKQLVAVSRQIELVNEQIASVEPLVQDQLLPRPRLLTLQQQAATLDAEHARELAELGEIQENMRATADVVQRARIVAPEAGKIVNLRYFTSGGVVKAGDALLDLVPQDDELLIEAQVRPLDIESIDPGLRCEIRLIAYNQQTTPVIHGTVNYVSADILTNERTGQSYYVARVKLDPDALDQASGVRLYPGMPAQVLILTGERTLLAYLLQPLRDSFSRAFREE